MDIPIALLVSLFTETGFVELNQYVEISHICDGNRRDVVYIFVGVVEIQFYKIAISKIDSPLQRQTSR